ncbi:MAG TPA: ribonuclease P protein component [Candidatus Megaira endosymbiont of Nemacystus decipiens]|nr:ribonuclease P protein component [Candidatus Megaera endosymbiont of Nemacystus decipiens]
MSRISNFISTKITTQKLKSFVTTLKNQKEFDYTNKYSKKFYKKHFTLVVSEKNINALHQSNNSNASQEVYSHTLSYGMKVGKKYSKKAVIRNKTKRRIHHMVRYLFNENVIPQKIKSIIIIPKNNFHSANFSVLIQKFANIFKLY